MFNGGWCPCRDPMHPALTPGRHYMAWLREVGAAATTPDITVVLDVDPGVSAMRRSARGLAREYYERRTMLARASELYHRAEHLLPGRRVVRVPGAQDRPSVAFDILAAIRPLLPGRGS